MGEGVSLSLPREGVPGVILLLAFSSWIFVPFTREHISLCERNFSGGLNLPATSVSKGIYPAEAIVDGTDTVASVAGTVNTDAITDAADTVSGITVFTPSADPGVISNFQRNAPLSSATDRSENGVQPEIHSFSGSVIGALGNCRGDAGVFKPSVEARASSDVVSSVVLNAGSGAIFSDLQGYALMSSDPGRSESVKGSALFIGPTLRRIWSDLVSTVFNFSLKYGLDDTSDPVGPFDRPVCHGKSQGRGVQYVGFSACVHRKCIKAMPSTEMSDVTMLMPKSWVSDPVFKSMPTPATGSMVLLSAGSPLSRGFGAGSSDPYVIGSGVRVLGYIGAGGPAQAKGGVVHDFWDPFGAEVKGS